MGVPVNHKSYMFGDNQAVITNSSIPHSSLNKRHNALAYHRVREMIAAGILGYYWIDWKNNPADIETLGLPTSVDFTENNIVLLWGHNGSHWWWWENRGENRKIDGMLEST